MVILAGRGGLCPTNLNECRDLRGHPRKQKPTLKESAPFWSTSGDDAETAIGNIFHFPFKGLRFSMALMQWQLAADKPPIHCIARLNPLFLRFLSHNNPANLTHQSTRKNERWMNREGRLGGRFPVHVFRRPENSPDDAGPIFCSNFDHYRS